jgi:transcriptional regulator with XRE-family HTH domain
VSFGEKLKRLREERDMSLRELSRKSDLALSHVQYLERDARTPGEETLRKLAQALGVSLKDLKTEQVSGQVLMLLSEVERPLTSEQRDELIEAVEQASKAAGSARKKAG